MSRRSTWKNSGTPSYPGTDKKRLPVLRYKKGERLNLGASQETHLILAECHYKALKGGPLHTYSAPSYLHGKLPQPMYLQADRLKTKQCDSHLRNDKDSNLEYIG